MSGLVLRDPVWLLALLPLAAGVWWSVRRRRHTAVRYSSAGLLAGLPVTLALRVKRQLPWLACAGLALCALALARPQHGKEEFRSRTEGVAIQVAIDRSGSMDALDFELDGKRARRIEAARAVTRDFVTGGGNLPGRPDDLVGLVAFGGFAESLCPLTLDHGALLAVLDQLDTPKPLVGPDGRMVNQALLDEESATAIGDGLALCAERLRSVQAKSKVLVLLSDGKNTAGVVEPLAAAEAAAEFGIRVYAVGIGSTGFAPFETTDVFGRRVLQRAPVELDEALLKAIAARTGGLYFNARDTSGLERVYAEIDQLEKTEVEGLVYTQYRELYQLLLLPGLALLALEGFLRSTRFRSLP